jgi:catechol 2,3-dioxygenase-like lactoylglutathione lyase family enzyme
MRRYERVSTLLTSNRPVDDWGTLLGDTAAVTALLDRLLHHAHVLKVRTTELAHQGPHRLAHRGDDEVELHESKPAEWRPSSENHMTKRSVQNLTPFVPAKDFALSSRFYRDLGFAEIASIDKAVRFERDGYGFWLQDYYVDDWAGNFMLCLYVDDLNTWWSHIKAMAFDDTYGSTARVLAEPHDQEGGLLMQFSDPSGVLWHIRQD